MTLLNLNLFAGWCSFLLGAVSGALIGLRFHREEWLGGYQSFRRRMVRLGHIAFFGLGLINILFALSVTSAQIGYDELSGPPGVLLSVASVALVIGAATMSLNCFLTAWRGAFRHLFFIPAGAVMVGIGCFLLRLIIQ